PARPQRTRLRRTRRPLQPARARRRRDSGDPPLSGERIVLEEPFRTRWQGCDPFAAVEALEGEVFREVEARRTLRTEFEGRHYFVKLHRGVGWREIFKSLLSLRLPVLGAGNEWLASRRLAELGVDALQAVAFGTRGANPARRHS